MHIVQVTDRVLPAHKYGGTERVMWSLAKALVEMGHQITFLAARNTTCDFARVIEIDPSRPITAQIPHDADIAHFHLGLGNFSDEQLAEAHIPIVTTIHGNVSGRIGINTIFVSRNHAQRHGATAYVYNGLDWSDYGTPDFNLKRDYFHFLAKAAWRIKNVKGAIRIVRGMPSERLYVLGGTRLNFKSGFRLTLSPKIHFCGMVDQTQKQLYMRKSKGLVFPVRWHEPFGLAMIESMWYGLPVFGTPYGSLPELIPAQVGFLSDSASGLREAMANWQAYSPLVCHEYVRDTFNAHVMAEQYLSYYEKVLNGETLNPTEPYAEGTLEKLPFYD